MRTRSAFAPPPTSKKFATLPPANLTASIVAIAKPAPLAIVPTVPSKRRKLRMPKPDSAAKRSSSSSGSALLPLANSGLRNSASSSSSTFASEAIDAAVVGKRERIDFHQFRAVSKEQVVERAENGRELLAESRIEPGSEREFAPDERRISDGRIDEELGDRFGMLFGNFFDVHAAEAADDDRPAFSSLRSMVIAQYASFAIGKFLFDQQRLDGLAVRGSAGSAASASPGFPRRRLRLVRGGRCELDLAGLAAAAHQHLRFDDPLAGVAFDKLRDLGRRQRVLAARHRNARTAKQFFPLVFHEVHVGR